MLNRVVPRQLLSDPRFVLGQYAIKGLEELSENVNVMLCHRSYTNVATFGVILVIPVIDCEPQQ